MQKEHIYNASNADGTLNAVIRWNIGGVDLVVDGKRKANALHFHGYRSATLANQRQLNQTVECLLSVLTPDSLKDGLKWALSCFPWAREVQTIGKYKGETTNAEGTQIKWYAVFTEEKLTVTLTGANFKLINIRASYSTLPTQEQMQDITQDVQQLLTLPLNEALQNIRLLLHSGKYECFKRPEPQPQPKREKPQPKPKQEQTVYQPRFTKRTEALLWRLLLVEEDEPPKIYAPQITWDEWEQRMMAEEQERENNIKQTIKNDGDQEKERTTNN